MANYYGHSRSNYFKVNDEQQFRAWCERRGLNVLGSGTEGFAIDPDSEDGLWPGFDPDTDEPIDIEHELSEHLQDNEVAILMHIGSEKLRYLCGYATAVNAAGERIGISLEDIYDMVKREWNIAPSAATN